MFSSILRDTFYKLQVQELRTFRIVLSFSCAVCWKFENLIKAERKLIASEDDFLFLSAPTTIKTEQKQQPKYDIVRRIS